MNVKSVSPAEFTYQHGIFFFFCIYVIRALPQMQVEVMVLQASVCDDNEGMYASYNHRTYIIMFCLGADSALCAHIVSHHSYMSGENPQLQVGLQAPDS